MGEEGVRGGERVRERGGERRVRGWGGEGVRGGKRESEWVERSVRGDRRKEGEGYEKRRGISFSCAPKRVRG